MSRLEGVTCQNSLPLVFLTVSVVSVAGGGPVSPQGSQVQQQRRAGAPTAAIPRPRQPQTGPR